jgi:hypothetical protein
MCSNSPDQLQGWGLAAQTSCRHLLAGSVRVGDGQTDWWGSLCAVNVLLGLTL